MTESEINLKLCQVIVLLNFNLLILCTWAKLCVATSINLVSSLTKQKESIPIIVKHLDQIVPGEISIAFHTTLKDDNYYKIYM